MTSRARLTRVKGHVWIVVNTWATRVRAEPLRHVRSQTYDAHLVGGQTGANWWAAQYGGNELAALANIDVTVWNWRTEVPQSKCRRCGAAEETRLDGSVSAGRTARRWNVFYSELCNLLWEAGRGLGSNRSLSSSASFFPRPLLLLGDDVLLQLRCLALPHCHLVDLRRTACISY